MPHSDIAHPYRIDANTLTRASGLPGASEIPAVTRFPNSIRLMSFNPAVFTHAYQLLGEQPQRFGNGLALYLSTVRTFFERADVTGGIDLTRFGNADSRRRLSEDLGIAYASLFMVQVFALGWDTISQIPQNRALAKKRPDFQGFANNDQRFMFEAKGTTGLTKIESSMSKAIGQVKRYPEQAEGKLAIVTYLCADDRFFPSASFVVDPPAMPETVPADRLTSKLLHLEKTLQFVGLSATAKEFIFALARKLSEQRSAETARTQWEQSEKLTAQLGQLRATLAAERQQLGLEPHRVGDIIYVGRSISFPDIGIKIFNAVAEPVLANAAALGANFGEYRATTSTQDTALVSQFNDGTLLQVDVTQIRQA